MHPALDGLRVARALDDRGLVLGDDDLARLTEQLDTRAPQRQADLFGGDQQRLARLDDLLQQRQQVLDGRDLRADQQDVRVLEDRFLTLRVVCCWPEHH
ncbi:hypothetical protein IFM12275_37710 [Nocardia sputorum]|uniref:Uncharacterized protein n=1 Tax=Nocardia sputorum TaxID=2984338 RepID=A0ABN6UC46_9NOCA|nr:hypothetical protein IFM12275_37710 [Nocardia sputorum]BDU02869.1 hypothetical protein IFM12276_58970 [Nocardia sputorum]